MAYPGSQGYYPAEQTHDHHGYPTWSPEPQTGGKVSHRQLCWAVVVLALCSYLVSFGPMLNGFGIDWDVRFAVLAGLLAGFGLLPRQTPTGKVVAVLAAAGFLDALSRVAVLPEGVQPGWAMWVVLVLNGLQAGAAVGALLTQPNAADEQQAWYAAYAEQYAQAAAQYYGEYADGDEPDVAYESGTAQAQQVHQVSAPEPRRASAPQGASYDEFVAHSQPTQESAPQAVPPTPSLPNVGHSAAPAQQIAGEQPEYRTSN
ncbi:DUF5336 domain-containing protein [Mycobacterium sp. TY815]|uniref:DUF5336 domain-containing protein n=1 Tax=Mycobacterium sp. TY815 TaxID=3050581 RepID=UPI000F9EB30B|nr:DUF5336 domain-containing protein [Mycobacterium sp. TY815]MDP7705233.1 DUF5336 domain-containing protein [Mycobacterium sp. TY815]RUP02455.1 MAG: hypothetical protein EKK34_23945 [Mycobacterium sp.]